MTAPQPKAHDTAAGPGSSGSRPPAHRRRTGILLALAATVTVLASCSSSSHSTASAGGSNTTAAVGSSATSATTAAAGSTGSGASSGGSPATGSPIYVGTECGAQPPQDMSECTTVPTAYFDQINSARGDQRAPDQGRDLLQHDQPEQHVVLPPVPHGQLQGRRHRRRCR